MPPMRKTTVYLPDDLKRALTRAARATRRTEADLIREGVRRVTGAYAAPDPVLPLFSSGDPTLSENVGGALEGFGGR